MNQKFTEFKLAKEKSEKKVIIGGALLILSVILFLILAQSGLSLVAIIVAIPAIVFLIQGFSQFNKMNKRFKSEVLTDLIASYVDNGIFIPQNGLSRSQVKATEFVKLEERYHSEDYLSGEIEGVSFISSDVKIEDRRTRHTKNGTQTYYVTTFLGRVFEFEFNKNFDGYIQVLEKFRPTVNRGYDNIKLESVVFNKKFKTYTTNDHSAFYVLTPHFMEALMSFEQNNKGNVGFSFIDNKLYIGINNFRDTFELKMFTPLTENTVKEFERELLVIRDVIKELKLNNNIFKEEN
jgi:hypothetical protein